MEEAEEVRIDASRFVENKEENAWTSNTLLRTFFAGQYKTDFQFPDHRMEMPDEDSAHT
jgi:hypothetical protein